MKNRRLLFVSVAALVAFMVWTVLVRFVDVQAIGPDGSAVGFAALNRYIHDLTGVHMWLYTLTDWLGLLPFTVAFGFAVLGLIQWISRKSILKVDRSILVLGVFYVAVIAAYVFFEFVVVNYRPVLIDGVLEASYPSSTTMLLMCVMPTAIMQFKERINNKILKWTVIIIIFVFTAFMVVARLISGVHWFSDILGGALLSASLVSAYAWGKKISK